MDTSVASAALATTAGLASQKISTKMVKQNAENELAVATMASNIPPPVNPNLGRNLDVRA